MQYSVFCLFLVSETERLFDSIFIIIYLVTSHKIYMKEQMVSVSIEYIERTPISHIHFIMSNINIYIYGISQTFSLKYLHNDKTESNRKKEIQKKKNGEKQRREEIFSYFLSIVLLFFFLCHVSTFFYYYFNFIFDKFLNLKNSNFIFVRFGFLFFFAVALFQKTKNQDDKK